MALVDAGARAGGQYWRHREGDDGARHHGWSAFRRLRDALDRATAGPVVAWLPGHAAWHVERTAEGVAVHCLAGGEEREVRARTLVIATGAYDRQLPFPGWTLPGVFTAGGVQALLKGQGVVAGRRIAVSGTGPFLLPVAAALAEAGASVVGVFEAGRPDRVPAPPADRARAAAASSARAPATWPRSAGPGVPYRTRTAVVAALGEDAVTGVRVAALDAGWRVVAGQRARDRLRHASPWGTGSRPRRRSPIQAGLRDGR